MEGGTLRLSKNGQLGGNTGMMEVDGLALALRYFYFLRLPEMCTFQCKGDL